MFENRVWEGELLFILLALQQISVLSRENDVCLLAILHEVPPYDEM